MSSSCGRRAVTALSTVLISPAARRIDGATRSSDSDRAARGFHTLVTIEPPAAGAYSDARGGDLRISVVIPALNEEAAIGGVVREVPHDLVDEDRKSTRLNSSHSQISYAVFCLKKKKKKSRRARARAEHEQGKNETQEKWV